MTVQPHHARSGVSELVVIGASAGGIEALRTIVAALPRSFGVPVLVVVHVPSHFRSRLPELLARASGLDVAHATHEEPLRPGIIRIAPPDHHLIVRDGMLHVGRTPAENRHRPSIDVLFRSAAGWYGARVLAVLLSGGPGDGPAGAAVVREAGGMVFVQDPADAVFGALPESALQHVEPDAVANARELGRLIAEVVTSAVYSPRDADLPIKETKSMDVIEPWHGEGWKPSAFACPDCTGVLWERADGRLVRFRCRVGHAYGPDALLDGQRDELEQALWSAINTMEERGQLAARIASNATTSGIKRVADRYDRTARDMERQSRQIRELLASWADPRLEGVASPQDLAQADRAVAAQGGASSAGPGGT
jgi:two-component system, chemotaxis family, protein-glutamate methylesterase/glutaminase